MKAKNNHIAGTKKLLSAGLTAGLALGISVPVMAQSMRMRNFPPGFPGGMVMPDSGSSSSSSDSGSKSAGTGPWVPSETLTTSTNAAGKTNAVEDIQLSFQGANVDMVAQWLGQTTGKAVIKHPRVQCQMTIMSSKKIPPREAVNMVYRALALEGFSAVELRDSILIVPAGEEPKMSPEVVSGSLTNLPVGRQRLVKVFPLSHIQAADLKDRIKTAVSDTASVDVDERMNRLVITDYNDNLRVVGELITALDTDRPEDVSVRVLPLKNISADQLAKEMEPLYQKMGGKSNGKGTLDIAADDRSNSLIVLSSQVDFDAIQRLVESLDTTDAQEKATQTFILKNADAEDVAKQLQSLNQNQGNNSSSRYMYFFGGQPDAGNAHKTSVVSDRRRNAVIVQAPPTDMANVTKLINELDEPVADGSLEPKIYPLKYVSATDIEDVLNELFLKKTQQRNYWDFFNDEGGDNSTADHDVGRLYGKVRITSEPYSNAIIVTSNSKENLAVIEDVLKQLDQPSEAGESTLRVGLKYAKSDTVANNLNILFARNGSPALRPVAQPNQNGQQQNNGQAQAPATASETGFDLEQEVKADGYYPWLGGQQTDGSGRSSSGDSRSSSSRTESDLVGRVRCVADLRGNALLVSANVHFFPQVLKLIEDLDAAADKVTIEARIVQVSADYLDKLGVRWSPDGSKVFSGDDYDSSLMSSTSGSYQKGFGGSTTANTPLPSSSSSSVVETLASLRSGLVTSTLNIDFLVQFLKKNVSATVLGEPSITIDDNELGKLFVGQQVPVPDNNQVSSVGSTSYTIKYKDVGVILEVTPHINSDGEVQLKIHAESSTVNSGGQVLNADVFDTDNFRTEVTAKNGQTLLIGGIIQKQISDTMRKTPFLGDIPGLGWAFKKKDKSTQEVELIVLLKPTVIHSAEDAHSIQERVGKQSPLLKDYLDKP